MTGRPIANLAPAVLYAAFLFGSTEAWLRLWSDRQEPARERSWFSLLAVYSAIALTLRPTAVPFIALLALSATTLMIKRRHWQALWIAPTLAGIVLLPAMISSWQASGTLFYPFLGRGVHGETDYGPTDALAVLGQAASEAWTWVLVAIVFGLWALLHLQNRAPKGAAMLLAILMIALVAVAWATGGLALNRYSFPIVFAVLAALAGRLNLAEPLGRRLERIIPAAAIAAGVGALALVTVSATPPGRALQASLDASPIGFRWRQPGLDADMHDAYRQAQAAVPAGDVILAVHLAQADRLDVRRNRVLTADQAATAGPAPGWPRALADGGLRDYLIASGIDHVAVSDTLFSTRPDAATAWQRGLDANTDLARTQMANAVRDVTPVATGPDFRIYRVASLN